MRKEALFGKIEMRELKVLQRQKMEHINKSAIYLFIQDISIVPLQVHYYSEVLPATALILGRS